MILDFSQNGISVVFEVTEDKKLALKTFSKEGTANNEEKILNGVLRWSFR